MPNPSPPLARPGPASQALMPLPEPIIECDADRPVALRVPSEGAKWRREGDMRDVYVTHLRLEGSPGEVLLRVRYTSVALRSVALR